MLRFVCELARAIVTDRPRATGARDGDAPPLLPAPPAAAAGAAPPRASPSAAGAAPGGAGRARRERRRLETRAHPNEQQRPVVCGPSRAGLRFSRASKNIMPLSQEHIPVTRHAHTQEVDGKLRETESLAHRGAAAVAPRRARRARVRRGAAPWPGEARGRREPGGARGGPVEDP